MAIEKIDSINPAMKRRRRSDYADANKEGMNTEEAVSEVRLAADGIARRMAEQAKISGT